MIVRSLNLPEIRDLQGSALLSLKRTTERVKRDLLTSGELPLECERSFVMLKTWTEKKCQTEKEMGCDECWLETIRMPLCNTGSLQNRMDRRRVCKIFTSKRAVFCNGWGVTRLRRKHSAPKSSEDLHNLRAVPELSKWHNSVPSFIWRLSLLQIYFKTIPSPFYLNRSQLKQVYCIRLKSRGPYCQRKGLKLSEDLENIRP